MRRRTGSGDRTPPAHGVERPCRQLARLRLEKLVVETVPLGDEHRALASCRLREGSLTPGLGRRRLLLEPAREDVVVVQGAERVLEPLPDRGRTRLLADPRVRACSPAGA